MSEKKEKAAKVDQNGRDKAANFVRLATKRVDNVLATLTILSRLSNKQNYSYTSAQVSQMMLAIRDKVDAVEEEFQSPGKGAGGGFSFGG